MFLASKWSLFRLLFSTPIIFLRVVCVSLSSSGLRSALRNSGRIPVTCSFPFLAVLYIQTLTQTHKSTPSVFSATTATDMGGEGSNPSCCCHVHPKQEMVGVCALCLRERLLVLASNYPQKTLKKQTKYRIRIGKVFALPSFFHFSHPSNKFDEEAASASISSLEESFISIKFEENGQASWHSNTSLVGGISSKRTAGHSDEVALRWRDRIAQLALYWTRTSSSASSCYDVKVDERLAKGRKGWMKSMTRQSSRTNYKQKGE